MFWKRKMTIKPLVLAETLFTELIQKRHCDIPAEVRLKPAVVPAIEAKIRLYQFTSILLAVMNEARSRPAFISVQQHLEQLFFHQHHSKVRMSFGTFAALCKT
jgi:hypothetical protein